MTGRGSRRSTGKTALLRPAERLVAVVDELDGDGLREHPQEPFDLPGYWALPPVDGDVVGIPTPCARLRAGYWCTCGGSFRSVRGGVPMTRARVEVVDVPDDEVDGVEFIEGSDGDELVPVPTSGDRQALRLLLDALPPGTVVERNGLGFAPLFRPRAERPFGYAAIDGAR